MASEKTQQPRRSVRQTSDQALDNNITWPYKMSADVEGLITLGGLHMIHERNNIKTCGPIMAQGGVQAMETMLYTIDHINQQEWWLKDVPLGNMEIFVIRVSTFAKIRVFTNSKQVQVWEIYWSVFCQKQKIVYAV